MTTTKGIADWIPLITKLIWPIFIIIVLLVFNRQVTEVYDVVVSGMKAGRSVEIGGFLKLGDAAAQTNIGDLSPADLSIEGLGGAGGVARKGGTSHLRDLQHELEGNPQKALNTLMLADNVTFSVQLLKQYVGTLGLQYVVFQRGGKFDGWIRTSTFVAQLPEDQDILDYDQLHGEMIGVSQLFVGPKDSARDVLAQMQELHLDSMPVVDADGQWLFFANRGEILSRLMSSLILADEG